MSARERISDFDEKTRVPFAWLVSLAVLLLGCAGGIIKLLIAENGYKIEMGHQMERITKELLRLEVVKRNKGVNSWTRESMRIWAADLESSNEGLKVPNPNSLDYTSDD